MARFINLIAFWEDLINLMIFFFLPFYGTLMLSWNARQESTVTRHYFSKLRWFIRNQWEFLFFGLLSDRLLLKSGWANALQSNVWALFIWTLNCRLWRMHRSGSYFHEMLSKIQYKKERGRKKCELIPPPSSPCLHVSFYICFFSVSICLCTSVSAIFFPSLSMSFSSAWKFVQLLSSTFFFPSWSSCHPGHLYFPAPVAHYRSRDCGTNTSRSTLQCNSHQTDSRRSHKASRRTSAALDFL